MTGTSAGLVVNHVDVSFGAATGLTDVSFSVGRGERTILLGRSGTGKTSLLRAIAGLGGLSGGTVSVDGRDVTALPPERRSIVYMHQVPFLFPHLSVVDNVGFPLEVRGVARPAARTRARALLEHVKLNGLAERSPQALSGGQRHRVALARALAADPAVLLLDEPFSSLDPQLRADVRQAVVDLLDREVGPSVVLVTHDVDEAAGLADALIVLDGGRILQQGSPSEMLARPRSAAVARLLGLPNLLSGHRDEEGWVNCLLGRRRAPGRPGPVIVTARPASIQARMSAGPGVIGTVAASIERVSGPLVKVRCNEQWVMAIPSSDRGIAVGSTVELIVTSDAIHVIDEE